MRFATIALALLLLAGCDNQTATTTAKAAPAPPPMEPAPVEPALTKPPQLPPPAKFTIDGKLAGCQGQIDHARIKIVPSLSRVAKDTGDEALAGQLALVESELASLESLLAELVAGKAESTIESIDEVWSPAMNHFKAICSDAIARARELTESG